MSVSNNSQQEDFDIVFIRHAQSEFNSASLKEMENLKKENITWLDAIEDDSFNQKVTYNPQYIDSPISKFGYTQCSETKTKFDPQEIDLIFVSPMLRVLETCREIFGIDNDKVVVHPLVMEVVRYACDISNPMEPKRKQFFNYDFSELDSGKWSEMWFLQILTNTQKHDLCIEKIKKKNCQTLQQKQLIALELLDKQQISENAQELRERVWKLKEFIQKTKNQRKAKKVAVVSHHYTTQCLLSPDFYSNGDVKGIGQIQNGKPYFRKLDQIMKVK